MSTPVRTTPVIGYNIALRHLVRRINDVCDRVGYTDVVSALTQLEADGHDVYPDAAGSDRIHQAAANTIYHLLTGQ